MGIYDRDYYRGDGEGWLTTRLGRHPVTKAIILVNVAAFIAQVATRNQFGQSWFTDLFEMQTDAVSTGQVWRLVTYAFLHSQAQVMHIVFNMLALWWFGQEVEEIHGPREYSAFYLVAALAGGLLYYGNELLTGVRHPMLGASGAVMATMVVFALHFPRRTIYLIIFPMPVIVFVALYFLWDVFGAAGGRRGENIAFAGHIGGAVFGFIYQKLNWRLSNLIPRLKVPTRSKFQPKLRVFEEPEDRTDVPPPRPARSSAEHLEAELDAVLEKVARHGRHSLTEREQQILMKASEVYKNRRK